MKVRIQHQHQVYTPKCGPFPSGRDAQLFHTKAGIVQYTSNDSTLSSFSPPLYDVRFFYSKTKKGGPIFRIMAIRCDRPEEEQYEIEILGQKKIRKVMRQFQNQYMQILSCLRVMGDALILLNPQKVKMRQQHEENARK